MRHLRMLGMMLLGAITLALYAAAMASAEEPGILPFLGAKESQVKLTTSEAKEPTLSTANDEVKCAKLDPTTATATGQHISLFNEVSLNFLECELIKGANKFKCRSENLKGEKDAEGTILMLVDLHLVNLLKEKVTLVPGLVIILLDQNTKEVGVVKIKCGVLNVEIKGSIKGLVLVMSLVKDVTSAEIDFPTTSPCDTSDSLCLKYETAELEFLCKFLVPFEACTQTVKVPVTSNVEVLFDD